MRVAIGRALDVYVLGEPEGCLTGEPPIKIAKVGHTPCPSAFALAFPATSQGKFCSGYSC